MKRNLNRWQRVKKRAYERDNGECVLCHNRADDVHHVIFRSKGGQDDIHNVVCLCREHHEMAHGVHAKEMREWFLNYLEEVTMHDR